MSTLIVLPVRGTTPSKTRLASLFDVEQRSRLMATMIGHMLAQMPSDTDLAIITRNPAFIDPISPDTRIIDQNVLCPGLNGALKQAFLIARSEGYRDMLMLPGDLPLAQNDELTSLLYVDGTMIIVGDRDQGGTNGLRLPTRWAESFRFGMGEQSFSHHLQEARCHGAVPVTVYRRGLAHDLDTPDDWYALPEETRLNLMGSLQPTSKGA